LHLTVSGYKDERQIVADLEISYIHALDWLRHSGSYGL
jgi:hypothetical protein